MNNEDLVKLLVVSYFIPQVVLMKTLYHLRTKYDRSLRRFAVGKGKVCILKISMFNWKKEIMEVLFGIFFWKQIL